MAWILFVSTAAFARADLDPGAKKPYALQVVLRISPNRVFTPLFQEQLQRDVQNHLKINFGSLARIEILRVHPLLREIEAKGLDAAVETWDAQSDRTTHFVLLDYISGAYEIRTRFHDGATGQPGPLAKIKRTNDRAGVAATIAQLIESSFSPVGTVTATAVDGKNVTLTLQGGDLGVPLDRWIQRGHVFAVSRIVEANGKQRGERVDWALLEALEAPSKGVCTCRYHHRYQEDKLGKAPGTLGFRALRLTTVTGPVKVQLLDDVTLKPLDGVTVRVKGSDVKVEPEKPFFTDRDGVAVSRASYPHLALVQVLSGDTVRAQFPVALTDGRTVVSRVKAAGDHDSLAHLDVRRDAWVRRVYDNVRMSSERALELTGQLNQSLEAARDAGRRSLPLLDAEIKYLEREHTDLVRLLKEKKNLHDGEQQLDELRKKAKELQALVDRIDGVLKNSAGDEKALGLHKLIERAQLLEAEAEFDEAIRVYDQVVQANPAQTATIQAKLQQLKKAWELKGKKHEEARKFIYQTWPSLDVPGLGRSLEEATRALAACKAAGDRLTPQKMMRANVAHTVNLKKELESLKRRDSEDNRNRAKAVAQISTDLRELHNQAAAFVGPEKK